MRHRFNEQPGPARFRKRIDERIARAPIVRADLHDECVRKNIGEERDEPVGFVATKNRPAGDLDLEQKGGERGVPARTGIVRRTQALQRDEATEFRPCARWPGRRRRRRRKMLDRSVWCTADCERKMQRAFMEIARLDFIMKARGE